MCQMLNIWHTKHHLTPFIRCVISHIFCNMLQYTHKFAIVRNWCGIYIYSFSVPLSLSYLFHLFLQLTASISTLSHISFFFSFSSPHISFFFSFSSLPPSLLSHISLSSFPSTHRLHLYSLTLPIRCSISDAADLVFSFSPSCRFKNLRVADFLFVLS